MNNAHACSEPDWKSVRALLPWDLEALARETGAFGRSRGFTSAESLLRMILLWALPNGSYRCAASEGVRLNLAHITHQALFDRVRRSEAFLEATFGHLLKRGAGRQALWKGYRVTAIDASVLCGPGATGTDQRLHVAYDLSSGKALKVDVTNASGGETFRRFLDLGKGHLVLGDQGYGHGPGVVPLLTSGASVLVRFNFYSIRLLDSSGTKIGPEEADSLLPNDDSMVEFEAMMPGWDKPLRVFGARNPEGKGVWFLTNLGEPELQKREVRDLYMMRWQIELYFKRLKSILDLDQLPSRDGPTSRQWIWAKLILATLAVLNDPETFSPYEDPGESQKPKAEQIPKRQRGRPRKCQAKQTPQESTAA